MHKIITCILFSITLSLSAQTYTLTVNNGYGGGSYAAGDTVHVYCNAYDTLTVFTNWTGDTTFLQYADEWHTWLVMPAQNVTISANFQPFYIPLNYELIKGRDILKPMYYAFPPNMKGVVYLLHGTGGSARGWLSLENRKLVNDLLYNGYGVLITEAEESTLNQDLNSDGKIRWQTNPVDTINNVDYVNIKILTDTFINRGSFIAQTKQFSVGMSNGGSYSISLSTIYQFKAGVSYCAQGNEPLFDVTNTPIQFCMQQNDNNENVGPIGNANALTNSNTLISRGICSRYYSNPQNPLYPERFARIAGITIQKSQQIFNDLQSNGCLLPGNFMKFAGDSVAAIVLANQANWPSLQGLTGTQLADIINQINCSFTAHQFFSDFNKRTIEFLNYQCSIPNTITEDTVQEKNCLFPNPTNGLVYANCYTGKLIIDVLNNSGQKVLSSPGFPINVSTLPHGLYFVRIFTDKGVNHQKIVVQ